MDKLIITCCINDATSWQGSGALHMPVTAREIADSVRAARDAGAAVARVNEPFVRGARDTMGYNREAWLEVARLIRQGSDVIYEHGQAGLPYFDMEEREPPVPPELRQQKFDLAEEKPDLIDTLVTKVDHFFGMSYHLLPMRNDIGTWLPMCRQHGVKPAFEAWQEGSFFELRFWINEGLVDPPYWVTLFFGAYSGVWSPPTTEELLLRVKHLPEHALWQASVFCGAKGTANTHQQLALLTQAITLGGHVRVGMEDNPFYWDGVPAESNAQLVERIVRIARDLGREVATPDEARGMLGLPPRSK